MKVKSQRFLNISSFDLNSDFLSTYNLSLCSASETADVGPSRAVHNVAGLPGIGVLAVCVSLHISIQSFPVKANFASVLFSIIELFSYSQIVVASARFAVFVAIFELRKIFKIGKLVC